MRDLLIKSSSTLATSSTASDAIPASSIAPPHPGPPQCEQRTPPHFSSQVAHAPHGSSLQSSGQHRRLQGTRSDKAGQGLPPLVAARMTFLWCSFVPPVLPQVLEQEEKGVHELTLQSTGHGAELHETVSCSDPHSMPSHNAGLICALERLLMPPSHDFVHADHAPHPAATQFCGQHELDTQTDVSLAVRPDGHLFTLVT